MFAVVKALIAEEDKRRLAGRADRPVTIRPGHGHHMLDDLHKKTHPGYSAIGRLKGLAEHRSLELGIRKAVFALEP